MEHGDVTPEFLDAMITKSIAFHKKTVDMLSEFYEEEIMRHSKFHKRMCNRFMENEVPLLNAQFESMDRILNAEIAAWSATVHASESVHCAELEYLGIMRARPITVDVCPITKFTAETADNPSWKRHVAEINARMQDAHVAVRFFKQKERLEIQNRLDEHTKVRDQWLGDLYKRDCEDTEAKQGILNAINLEEKVIVSTCGKEAEFEESLEESVVHFHRLLDHEKPAMLSAFDFAVTQCKEAIDFCIKYNSVACSDAIRVMNANEVSRIDNFHKTARDFLEKTSVKFQYSFNKGQFLPLNQREDFTYLMTETLKSSIQELKSELKERIESLHAYRKTERDEIRKLHTNALQEHERFILEDKYPMNPYPTVDLSEFENTKKLIGFGGEGSVFQFHLPGELFAKVWQLPKGDIPVAVKKFERTKGIEEVLALHQLTEGGINIVSLFGRGTLDGERYLIMEYCPRSLADVIDDCRALNDFLIPTDYMRWVFGITAGLRHIHNMDKFHADIKPQNILIDLQDTAKIADFGLSSFPISKGATVKSSKGTARYMSPEQHAGKELDLEGFKRCDLWAFGIVLWEMITCQTPFSNVEDHRLALVIGKNDTNSHPPLPRECTFESLQNLLKKCWSPEIYRPSFHEILTSILPDLLQQLLEDFDELEYWREECEKWTARQ